MRAAEGEAGFSTILGIDVLAPILVFSGSWSGEDRGEQFSIFSMGAIPFSSWMESATGFYVTVGSQIKIPLSGALA